ncbi:hypothetical protein RF11_03616 [Thelohanellus kitauei]|uniref:Uncharacterized protein n=1 Tax=Thelohanellus kitauei TaxID=669202 RepID=A0A0C2N0M7_THEKT|nr:hypothetical protein RF11_03616 [Thelohanellus kitauei]
MFEQIHNINPKNLHTSQFKLRILKHLEVFKPAPVHFCTDFTSTASATVSTYGRVVLRLGTFLQAVKVVQDSHLLNTHPHPQPTRATLPSRHSFAGKMSMLDSHVGWLNRLRPRILNLVVCKDDKRERPSICVDDSTAVNRRPFTRNSRLRLYVWLPRARKPALTVAEQICEQSIDTLLQLWPQLSDVGHKCIGIALVNLSPVTDQSRSGRRLTYLRLELGNCLRKVLKERELPTLMIIWPRGWDSNGRTCFRAMASLNTLLRVVKPRFTRPIQGAAFFRE